MAIFTGKSLREVSLSGSVKPVRDSSGGLEARRLAQIADRQVPVGDQPMSKLFKRAINNAVGHVIVGDPLSTSAANYCHILDGGAADEEAVFGSAVRQALSGEVLSPEQTERLRAMGDTALAILIDQTALLNSPPGNQMLK